MIIEIQKQVKITERLKEPADPMTSGYLNDERHTVDKVITSPEFSSEQEAQNWLIEYLKFLVL